MSSVYSPTFGLLIDPTSWNPGQVQGGSAAGIVPKAVVEPLMLDKGAPGAGGSNIMSQADPEVSSGGWLDDEIIAGFKNKYLLAGAGALLVGGIWFLKRKKSVAVAGYRRRSRR